MRKTVFILIMMGLFIDKPVVAQILPSKQKRENIEWLDMWVPNNNECNLPKVLLIGNSITKQYYGSVEKQLRGKACVSRLSTSKSVGDPALLKEVSLALEYHDFDVIHFNNGMHGWNYSEDEYKKAFPDLYETIRKGAPNAKLIWANTTPIKSGDKMDKLDSRTYRIIERNRIACEFLKDKDVIINDLFSLALNNSAFYGENDGIHPRLIGVNALANQVSDHIRMTLGDVPGLTDFPEGFTPREIGSKLSMHFIPGKHFLHDGKWIHYAEVCTWLGALRYARNVNDDKLIELLRLRFEPLFSTESEYLPIKNHVDLNMFGCLPLELYKATKDMKYYELGMPYADTQWETPHDANKEQKGYSKKGYSWQTRLWIDDMFMITIIQSQAYSVTGDKRYIERAAKEMVYYLDKLQRPNGLFYHAPDVPFYWARGNGWMAAGMAELLKALPHDNVYRKQIMKGYLKMMDSLKKYQGKDGMWKQLIDKEDCWPETSGSAMFAYAVITGVKNGWLNDPEYITVARRAWLSLVTYIDENGDVREVCVGTNKKNDLQYYYDRPRIAGDYHGQAPYLWCVTALLE